MPAAARAARDDVRRQMMFAASRRPHLQRPPLRPRALGTGHPRTHIHTHTRARGPGPTGSPPAPGAGRREPTEMARNGARARHFERARVSGRHTGELWRAPRGSAHTSGPAERGRPCTLRVGACGTARTGTYRRGARCCTGPPPI